MPTKELNEAYKALQALLEDVTKMQNMNKHEGMKNTFLGGMRDGESWGLRKWLSKHGGALSICNDVELIWGGLRVLDKSDPKIIEIAKRLRPKMKNALDHLKRDVPKAYQEVSSAHPYLPFFHRLESALKGLSEFDPEDDDVICLDDSDNEDAVKPAAKSTNSSAARTTETSSFKNSYQDDDDDDDDESEVEVVGVTAGASSNLKPKEASALCGSPLDFGLGSNQPTWRCVLCTFQNAESQSICVMCDSDKVAESEVANNGASFANSQVDVANKQELAEAIESIANSLEEGLETRPPICVNISEFWSHPSSNYVVVLRLFRDLLLSSASRYMLDPISIDEDLTTYYALIKNPLGFRDIVKALVEFDKSEDPGKLPNKNLKKWNMFEGKWLIQGVDLVMLNTLAFLGKEVNPLRKQIMGMRKLFWKSLRDAGCPDKKQMPTRRTENSDFLLHRSKK